MKDVDFINRVRCLAKEIVELGMQTKTHELDLTTAEFGETWRLAKKIVAQIEQLEAQQKEGG